MKKILLILLLFSTESFANNGECHVQRNPMGFANYNVCEVAGTDYVCVTVDGKSNGGISCFLVQKDSDSSAQKDPTQTQKRKKDAFDEQRF